jgi:hypothetical protein
MHNADRVQNPVGVKRKYYNILFIQNSASNDAEFESTQFGEST